jgi:hypothetical protein
MRDFTLKEYKKLLAELIKSKYKFMTFAEFMEIRSREGQLVILRHDVDKMPLRSLRTAEMENELGIKGTYYFRVENKEFPSEVIEHIAKFGHEIGYHYETMDACKGNSEKAWEEFKSNLAILRNVFPVATICQHGSPRSKWDNRELWKVHDYKELGIIGEPYLDIDFKEVLYLTDTGRRWDGDKVSIRDKVSGERLGVRGDREEKRGEWREARGEGEDRGQEEKGSRGAVGDPPVLYPESVDSSQESVDSSQESVDSSQESVDSSKKTEAIKSLKIHSTMDIINAIDNHLLPDKIMVTVHPQRWTDNYVPWMKELIWQNVKNGVKYFLVRKK